MSALKKKHISKKLKSAWRKTDITDVEQFLEEQRQEERIGSFKDKQDAELFSVDVTPSKVKTDGLSRKQRRKLNAKKPLKTIQSWKNTSKVPDPIAKRNIVRQKKNGRNIEEEVLNPTKPRHLQANKDRAEYYKKLGSKLARRKKPIVADKDIWTEEDFRDRIPALKDEKGWISRDLAVHNASNMGIPVVKMHSSIRHRTTKAKNFVAPHAGMSYNPSLKDHQDLLTEVADREVKIIKSEKHLKRVTTNMFMKVTPEERDERKLMEMQAGLSDTDSDKADDGIKDETKKKSLRRGKLVKNTVEDAGTNGDVAHISTNPPVENKKKSKQVRNKQLLQKERQKRHEAKKAHKKQIADINRIKSLKAEVSAEAEALNELKKRRKKANLQKKFEPKRLGRHKYVEPDADVNRPEDIAGNVRNIKPESSLLIDRFKSFQKRNILPTTVAAGKQKAKKVKRFVRSSHKEPGISYDTLRQQRRAQKPTTQ